MLPKNLPTAYTAECLFDSRVFERHIAEGRITQAGYDAYLAGLTDEAEEVVESELRFTIRGRPLATAGYVEDES